MGAEQSTGLDAAEEYQLVSAIKTLNILNANRRVPGQGMTADTTMEANCLRDIATSGYLGGRRAREMIVRKGVEEPGGVRAIADTMMIHALDAHLIERAVQALGAMCSFELETTRGLVEDGGIAAVIQAMRVHKNDRAVQAQAVWTLVSVAQWQSEELTGLIAEAGGIPPLLSGLRLEEGSTAAMSCEILLRICQDAPRYASEVRRVGGYTVGCAMREHRSDVIVVCFCDQLLGQMWLNVLEEDRGLQCKDWAEATEAEAGKPEHEIDEKSGRRFLF